MNHVIKKYTVHFLRHELLLLFQTMFSVLYVLIILLHGDRVKSA